jgi:hypothetical protein
MLQWCNGGGHRDGIESVWQRVFDPGFIRLSRWNFEKRQKLEGSIQEKSILTG